MKRNFGVLAGSSSFGSGAMARPAARFPMRLMALAALCALALSTATALPASVPATMTVQVRSAVVRGAPSALSPPLFLLEYGAQVSVTRVYEGWAVLAVKGRTDPAYMYLSSLAETRLGQPVRAAQAGGTAAPAPGVTAPELALAGKGFDALPGEDSALAGFGSLKLEYALVDKMEGFAYDQARCALFLEGGG